MIATKPVHQQCEVSKLHLLHENQLSSKFIKEQRALAHQKLLKRTMSLQFAFESRSGDQRKQPSTVIYQVRSCC